MERYFYYLWISCVGGIGARNAFLLLEAFDGPENLWNASYDEIVSRGFTNRVAELVSKSRGAKAREDISGIIDRLAKMKIKCLSIADENYPQDLLNIYSPPIILYFRGELPDKSLPWISVIGTRRCTEYGKKTAYEFSKALAGEGAVVVSGMAEGIDSVAHKGALDGGGKTVAVLGCGVDICYPAFNQKLMDNIIDNGCVVSEYPPGSRPLPGNFPARNRIISGLSGAVLVVEAGRKSGTLITVDHALEQGKDVFALPGNVTSPCSTGTNFLISQGASMVTSPGELLDEIKYMWPKPLKVTEEYADNPAANLDEDEINVYGYVGSEPVHIEAISEKTGYSVPTLTYILTCLELKNMINKLPGSRYVKA